MQFSLSSTITMTAFGNFCPKSIWDKCQFQVTWSKNSGTYKMSISKVDMILVYFIFSYFYLLVPKIEIRLKQFLDKNPQPQPLCYVCAKLTLPLAIQNVCTSNKRKRQQVDIRKSIFIPLNFSDIMIFIRKCQKNLGSITEGRPIGGGQFGLPGQILGFYSFNFH